MLHFKKDFRSDRAACGALVVDLSECTAYPDDVQCPACLAIIRENKAKSLGVKVTQLFEFRPDERVISAGPYRDSIIVTTTERVWRLDHPDSDENMRMQILTAIWNLML